jgi:anti-sigma regulatory factor (Ser/Thr protein kinase)
MLSVEFVLVTSLQLPPDHAAAARARRFVSDTLRGWGCEDVVPDAQLLVSELVTNAVLHARSATRVTVERNGATVRVSVDDDSSAQPRLRELGPEAVTGRGLLLVDRIAQRWGVDPRAGGKCVWFEVDGRERVS